MSNNDWTNKLRDSLADYQEPVKADLWASIEQSLAQQGAAKPKSARQVALKKWSAVAAAAAVLAIGGSYVYLHQPQGSADIASLTSKKSLGSADLQSAASKNESAAASKSSAPLLAQSSSKPFPLSIPEGPADLQSAASKNDNVAASKKAVSNESVPVVASIDDAPPAASTQQEVARNNNLKQDDALFGVDFANDLKKQTASWSVQLYAENGLINTSPSNQGGLMVANTYYDSSIPGSLITETSFAAPYATFMKSVNMKKPKHHAPLSVGVQVGIPLSSRLSLTTGAVYTRVASDFALLSSRDYDTHQVLHYVGVPVGLNYEIWGTRRLHTYVMAGGEADFNVKNSTTRNDETVDDVKRDRPQFSAKASVGAQLDVTPQIGVYVEPGAKYYFDNGSSIDNTFKDKKLNFNFQFGLRWNIGK